MQLPLALSILASVISVSSFALNRKDKSNQDTEKDSYKWGSIDEKLSNIEKTLAKIEDKLDTYEDTTKQIVQDEIDKHVLKYHNK